MRNILLCAFMAVILMQSLSANDIYKFIPRNSQQVLQVNLSSIIGMETIKQDLIRNVNRQAGLDQKNDKLLNFSDLIEKIVVVTPDLTVDRTYLFVKFKMTETEFCRKLEETAGVKLVTVPGSSPVERRFSFDGEQLFPGAAMKKRTFALAFLTGNVAIIAKDDLTGYRQIKDTGLSRTKQLELQKPKKLAAGFVELTPAFLAENPYLPQIQRAVYSLSAGNDGSLQINASAVCADEQTANQTLMQVQQYIMVGGIVLNQLDPELMQEWLVSVKAVRDQNAVSVNGNFTRSFINRLSEASEKLAGTLKQAESADGEKKR